MSDKLKELNKRAIQRQKTLLPGIVTTLDGRSSFDCVVRDLSANGAKLALRDSEKLPELFFFINVQDRVAHKAKLVWRSNGAIGASFQSTLALRSGIAPSLRFLNRLWVERAAR